MKRVIPFLLALLLLLSACGQITPEPITGNPTEFLEEETSTEAPFLPNGGESNGVTWQALNLNSAEGKEATQWLAEQWEEYMKEGPTQFPMGKDKTVIQKNDTLTLRENKTGKETVLLEKSYLGEETTPEEALLREEAWRYPRLIKALDERYFAYCWGYWEGSGGTAIYDTQKLRTIPIAYGEKYQDGDWFLGREMIFADALYLTEGTYGPYGGPLRLMRVDLKALPALKDGEDLPAVNVLEDSPGLENVQDMNTRFVTPDERYFILTDYTCVRVYDLQKKQLLLQLPASVCGIDENESYWWPDSVILRGSKVYWTDSLQGDCKYLAEITLP